MEEELKALIAAKYDPLQLIDQLGLDMDELVEALWPHIEQNMNEFVDELEEIYNED